MVKGVNDKQSGFWMYLERVVRPGLEQKLKRRLKGPELQILGTKWWAGLGYEEKEEWKIRAKEFNRSEAGQNEKMQKRIDYRRRKHVAADPANMQRSLPGQKSKPSNNIPQSSRYDEFDEYSRKYFAGVDDDFEGMREHSLKELIEKYQWKFTMKGREAMEDFIRKSEVIVATANIYYEDSSAERMVPSELSILKFNITRGIYDQRHYLIGFGEPEIPNEVCRIDAEENEQATGLLMDPKRMNANVRFDYATVWDEVKEFTGIAGEEMKLYVLADEWNTVVGSFDTLFVRARDRSFARIESRFATLEDYFMAIYATLCGVDINDEIKLTVATEMRERWPGAVIYDLATCDFHAKLQYSQQCVARSCSLFAAHEAAFNFFTLCKQYVFPTYEFTGNHMPEKARLPTLEQDFLECRSQRSRFRTMAHATSMQNISQPPAVPERPLKSILKKPSSHSVYNGRPTQQDVFLPSQRQTRSVYNAQYSHKDDERRSVLDQPETGYDVERWLQDQGAVPQENAPEMDFRPNNPHVNAASRNDVRYAPPDPITEQQSFPSYPFNQPQQEIPPDPFQRLSPTEIYPTGNQKSSSGHFPNKRFSSAVVSNEPRRFDNAHDPALVDLGPADDDSDSELFSNISLPTASRRGQRLLARRLADDQTDAVLQKFDKMRFSGPDPIPTRIPNNNAVNSMSNLDPYRGGPTGGGGSLPVSVKTSTAPFPGPASIPTRTPNSVVKIMPNLDPYRGGPTGGGGNFPVPAKPSTASFSGKPSTAPFRTDPSSILVPTKLWTASQSALNEDQPGPSRRTTADLHRNGSDPMITQKPLRPTVIHMPERSPGGFCIPSVVAKKIPCTKKNHPPDGSTVSLESGSRSVRSVPFDQTSNGVLGKVAEARPQNGIGNKVMMPKNPHTGGSTAWNGRKEMKSEASTGMSYHSSTRQLDTINAKDRKSTNQLAEKQATKINFKLKPLMFQEAKQYGWPPSNALHDDGRRFAGWTESAHF